MQIRIFISCCSWISADVCACRHLLGVHKELHLGTEINTMNESLNPQQLITVAAS